MTINTVVKKIYSNIYDIGLPQITLFSRYLEDGEEGQSVFFPMGVGSGIKGLELGVVGMCVGEKRRITIPPKLVRHGRNQFEGKE